MMDAVGAQCCKGSIYTILDIEDLWEKVVEISLG